MNDALPGAVVGVRVERIPQVVFVTIDGPPPSVGNWVTIVLNDARVPGRVVIGCEDIPSNLAAEFPAVSGFSAPDPNENATRFAGYGSIGWSAGYGGDGSQESTPTSLLPGEVIRIDEGRAVIVEVDRRGGRIEFRMVHDGSTIVRDLAPYEAQTVRSE